MLDKTKPERLPLDEPGQTIESRKLPVVVPPAGDDDSGAGCWAVPAQQRIEVSGLHDGGVEIEQIGDTSDDDVRIHVAGGNEVKLARSILYAAGFKTIRIATRVDGGYVDVEDGNRPWHF